MMSSPFFCNHCGRDLLKQTKNDDNNNCSYCTNSDHGDKTTSYKGLLGESYYWQEHK